MRKNNKVIYILDFLVVIAIVISIISANYIKTPSKSVIAKSEALTTYLSTNYFAKEEETDNSSEEKESVEEKEETTKEEPVEEVKTKEKVEEKKQIKEPVKTEEPKKKETKSNTKEEVKQENKPSSKEKVIEKLTGSLAGYGPDCYGCTSFRTASGKYIGDGNIYYEDKEFGKIRIVAGDKSYPYGTIVKLSNTGYYSKPIYAVVLDRGGGVGKGRKFLFDLLFETEKDALKMGSRKNVTFEILILGY